MSILVINPNSSQKVTDNLEKILVAPPGIELAFYTGPPEAPKEIDGERTLRLSEKAVLPDLLKKTYIQMLGIMQATLLYSYANARLNKSFVLTSTSGWNALLDAAIVSFTGTDTFPSKKFQRTRALDVLVLSLSDPEEFKKITDRVEKFLHEYRDDDIDCVLLGCAGMAGLDEKLTAKFPGIVFVDSVKIGVEFLTGLMHFHQ
ncbi:CIC11C00000005529 [Sungouiella intermedia]|uniref:CIC11C00000005529 n=1 Tax=Sungouiella intermedia TaxID=45354 RepID=A0A1L0BZR3_9ASCO|nr:CIC11C00000005529 [[Candida] intermedia]